MSQQVFGILESIPDTFYLTTYYQLRLNKHLQFSQAFHPPKSSDNSSSIIPIQSIKHRWDQPFQVIPDVKTDEDQGNGQLAM